MAKGDAGGRYAPGLISSFADVERELTLIAAAFGIGRAGFVEFLHVEPEKRFDGLTTGADGTDWNPGGGGQGVYTYYNGSWHKLG